MPASKTSKTEIIDERVLRLLSLEDVFDLDYGTYATLLKEALVKYGVVSKQKIPTEEIELLRDEYKKARGKSGRFKAKSKKIKAVSVSGLKILKGKKDKPLKSLKLLPGTAVKTNEEGSAEQDPLKKAKTKGSKDTLEKIVSSIRKSVDSIANSVKSINKVLNKSLLTDKKLAENQRRAQKEKGLEGGKSGGVLKKMVGAVVKPFESIFDKIFKFIFWTLLGNTFFKLLDWFKDEKNKKKIDNIFRFIKDWWPAILTGFLAFATPLGGFIATITGTLIRGLFMLARVNPALTAALALFGAGALIPMLFPETVDEQERNIAEAEGTNEEKIKKLREQKENLNWFQKNVQGMGPEIDEQVYRLETGETKSYKPDNNNKDGAQKLFNGGKVNAHPRTIRGNGGNFAKGGKINKTSGVKISGAGPDTQLIAAQPGEIVFNKKTVDALGSKNLLALNATYGGSNANKPMYAGNIRAARFGGLIRAFNRGGEIPNADSKSDPSSIENERLLKEQKSDKNNSSDYLRSYNPVVGSPTPGIQDRIDAEQNAKLAMLAKKISNHQKYAKSKGKFYDARNQKTYVNKNDADAAYKSRMIKLASQQGLDRLSSAGKGKEIEVTTQLSGSVKSISKGKRFDAQDAARTEEIKKRGGWKGQLSRSFTGTLDRIGGNPGGPDGVGKSRYDAADKASRARVKQAGAEAIGRYYSSSDGKYYKDYAAASKAREKRLAKLSKQQAAQKKDGKVGGGMINITENTGFDVPGGGADRQFLPGLGFLQPGEKLVALTKDAVDRGGAEMVDSVNAKLDSNSNAWKSGGVTPLSPGFGGSKMVELPPSVIDNRKSGPMPGSASESTDISTSPPFGMELREQIKRQYYGIGAPS